MEQRLSDRITCVEANGRLEIQIRTRKNWWLVAFLPVWWIGWTAGGIAIFVALILGNPLGGSLFSVIWLIMWVFSWAFTAYAWLWNAFGREIVAIDSEGLSIKRDVFGIGPTKTLSPNDISKLRASGLFGNLYTWSGAMAYWGLSGGVIAFDLQGTTHRFGLQLEEQEAHAVVERMQGFLPESASSV